MNFMTLTLILAHEKSGGIGYKNKLPWHIPSELQHFKNQTMNQTLIVGRSTFEHLPKLPNRKLIVLTSNSNYPHENIQHINQLDPNEHYFVIGGAKTAKSLLPYIDHIILTNIQRNYYHDVSTNDIHESFDHYISKHFVQTNQTISQKPNEPIYSIHYLTRKPVNL